ncbi:MAG: mechanosensitive ion channel family protein, partial [Myxococcota bacterium]
RARRGRSGTERWIRGHVPDNLEKAGALGVEWWQWIALPLLALVSAGVGRVAGGVSRASLHRLVRATPATWDDALLLRSRGPLYLAWAVGVAWLLVGFLYLRAPAAGFVTDGLRIGLLLALVWLALRGTDIAGEAVTQTAAKRGNPGAASVVPLVVRSSKIGLVALGAVSVLSALGYPVASLLAGLGIGGLALALAAQKTAENVFGSVSIGVDQPFRVGDLVKIEDFLGVVERIGLRSTSIRTADRTLVTLPNGRLADMRVENFSVRDRMRLFCTIALEHGTPAETVRAVLTGLEARLRAHPNLWPDVVTVRLARIGPHSLDIDVAAWFVVPDPDAFLVVRQDMLLQFLEVVEQAGARIALPAQAVHVVGRG